MTRSGHSASARSWHSRGSTRNRGEGRGGTGFPDTISPSGIVTAGPGLRLHDALAVGPPHADPEQIGQRGTAARAGLAGHHPAYDDAVADDVGTQSVGLGLIGHDERLG